MTDETRTENTPDWDFDTNEDLRSHAFDLVASFAARMLEMEVDPDRPAGTAAHAHLAVPCPDENNVTRQAIYVGYCAEACKDNGMVVRSFTCSEEGGVAHASLLICSATALAVAWAEQQAEDNPDRSTRTH